MMRRSNGPEPAEVLTTGASVTELILPLRRMVARLAQRNELPARLSLIAALRQEGVSYVTLALATTIAHDLAARVCAVELNWWWPGLGGRAAAAGPGLAGVLGNEVSLDEALLTTRWPHLSLLPAGRLPVGERAATASGAELRQIIDQLGERFDYLLFDVPAILTTSEAIWLAGLGEACCLVVRQGVTPVHEVRQALDDVAQLPVLGVVLNQAQTATPHWLQQILSSE